MRSFGRLRGVFSRRCKASCVVGCAGGSGRSSCRTTSAHLTPRAWERETRSSLTWWRPRRSTCSSSPSWSTASCGHSGWRPAPKNPPLDMTMSAASSLIGIINVLMVNSEEYCGGLFPPLNKKLKSNFLSHKFRLFLQLRVYISQFWVCISQFWLVFLN